MIYDLLNDLNIIWTALYVTEVQFLSTFYLMTKWDFLLHVPI